METERVDIELRLMGAAEDACEDLTGGGTEPGPIAAAHDAHRMDPSNRISASHDRGLPGAGLSGFRAGHRR